MVVIINNLSKEYMDKFKEDINKAFNDEFVHKLADKIYKSELSKKRET